MPKIPTNPENPDDFVVYRFRPIIENTKGWRKLRWTVLNLSTGIVEELKDAQDTDKSS